MPFGDDFSYTKSALDFAHTGHFIYNGWAVEILGWMVPWGALFIKLFGFSFNVVRLSMLPIAMAAVYVFHQILRRFGINRRNAILGALTMALSPLFLPMAASYMTDVPGLLVILLCIYMCQRAVAATSDNAALLWLCSAMLINVAGGTVRQIAWLGALVMVPSTAWLLRERRGMKIAGVLLWISSLLGILACLHWFNQQPYSVPEHILAGPIHPKVLVHLAAQLLKTFLCLLLVIFPVSVAWLLSVRRLTGSARLRFAAAMAVLGLLAIILDRKGVLDFWVEPWLIPLLQSQPLGSGQLWVRLGISLLVVAPALIVMEQMVSRKRNKLSNTYGNAASWSELGWVLFPFSISYVMLLMPRGTFSIIQDRYLLGLVPTAIVILLRLYQELVTIRPSAVSLVTLIVCAVYAIGGAHDLFVGCRALASTIQMVQSSGVPRRAIQAGLASDGWTQIEDGGYINDPRIQVPAGAYNPNTPELKLPQECTLWFASFTPAITPKYFLIFPPLSCFARTKYPPVPYRTWLPPFHGTVYVQQLRKSSN